MKKMIMIIMAGFMLTGCTNTSSPTAAVGSVTEDKQEESTVVYYDYMDEVDENDSNTLTGNSSADMLYDISDPNVLKENSTNVFLGTVVSKDYATCNPEGMDYIPTPYTVGKISVLENYVGNSEGTITFYRSGGTVTLDEFLKNAPQERIDKFNALEEENGEIQYIHSVIGNDIDLDAGTTYLFYANYDADYDRYFINGYEYGTREVDGYSKNGSARSAVKIKDNTTGEYQSFREYYDSYLKS